MSTGLYFGAAGDDGKTVVAAQSMASPTPLPSATATVVLTPANPPAAEIETPEPTPEPPPAEVPPPAAPVEENVVAPTSTPRTMAPAPTATPIPPPPPTATPVPAPPPAAPASLGVLEQSMLIAHNAERAAAGLPPLVADASLTQMARTRAQDMASRNYFSHTSPTGQTAFTLLSAAGYPYSLAGENLARNNYPDSQTVSMAMSGFMSSQSHRINVLEPKFRYVGIGLATTADGMKYFAVIFAAP